MTTLPRLRGRRSLAAAALTLLSVGAIGFATGADTSPDAGSSMAPRTADAPRPAAGNESAASTADLDTTVSQGSDESAQDGTTDRMLISNGTVSLASDDVAQSRFDVIGVSDRFAGEVESQESQTDRVGEVVRARLVLRIPTERFLAAMDDLSATAQLLDNNSSTADVTTEVMDKDIRIEIQRDSIDRIALLLDQAQSIRDIVSIEAQLSRRQADLATLEQRQRYLADQTAMSTVTVSIQRSSTTDETEERDTAGFLVGLSDGWNALTALALDASTAVGAVLPFAAVGAVIGFPVWTVLRRRRRALPAAG